ncbi:polyketide cyclase [Mycobacterium sp. 852013-50091_SCH5140682]|uniref:SRPBCC family protein n=1 Tax=Mycobacterium sp. 852013-50091_SCH5140682 TaxID=1834109 RepID=UPI0007EA34D0|nr:SRPBCC family protein [Mycobacterium sp. 852013-50091_SCH5140682]OBC00656.1 polyketide cyclase [Mycobacterium sp. 852013-50091_SCH5140682]
MPTIHVERVIAAPLDQVFDWMADPAAIGTAPLVLKAGWANGSPGPAVGAVRAVTGAGMWFREEITAFDRPNSYSYLIIGSFPPFDHDGGTLTFTPRGEGTHVDWLTTYTHTARSGGKVMEAVSSRLLPWNFRAILANCAKALER